MTEKDILTPLIQAEFQKYQMNEYRIKLRSIPARRAKYSIICGIIAVASLLL